MLHHVIEYIIIEMIFVSDFKLILESSSPVFVLSEVLHTSDETVLQELLGNV
jgi:hypothetical protein